MVLTVIVPDDRAGMQRMLATELANIDSEIIYDEWRSGLQKAQGDFILLLEHDSAVERGNIASMLDPFLSNPHYRKLAMVSPLVEFDDTNPTNLVYGDNSALISSGYHSVRFGSLAGSIIRRTSLIKYCDVLVDDIIDSSYALSIAFWEHGLRIMSDPQSLYYSPTSWSSYVPKRLFIPDSLTQLWEQECIV